MTIRNKLIAMAVVVLAVIATMAGVTYYRGGSIITGLVNTAGMETIRSAAQNIDVRLSKIEAVVMKHDEVLPHYMIYVDRVDNLDRVTVKIELNPEKFSDTMNYLQKAEKSIESDIASITGIHAKVLLVEPRSLPRSEGKMKRVIDSRFAK